MFFFVWSIQVTFVSMSKKAAVANARVPPRGKGEETKPEPAKPALQPLVVNTGVAATNPKGPQKSYNQLMQEQDTCMKSFLDDLTYLVGALKSKNPRDPDLDEVRDRFMAVKNEVPALIMTGAGACIWKYRAKIAAANTEAESFFLAHDFKADYAAIRKELPPSDDFEKFPEVLHKIKLTWHQFSPAEKGEVWTRAKRMLKMYATYEGNRRALEGMRV